MSYQVLARKWRPKHIQTMVGQEHVLRMLTNALDHQRLHHAYLFTGTRGVGKTTLARILAKCLNCEQGISSTPCGECAICQAVDTGRFLDLIEVDAASRTKVEDTREILDNVQYAPSQGRYKIYLIDEVHMLSGHSFNALLKTLEEPPAHVKFLLATTDPKRLPITILSRCLQFNLKRVPVPQIAGHLQHICQTENIAFEEAALQLLGTAADGSMRDALSLLDQAIAFCGDTISTKETQNMLGSIEIDAIYRLLDTLAEQDGKKLLAEIAKLAEHAPDFNQVLEDLLSVLHQVSIAQVIAQPSDTPSQVTQLAKQLSPEETQLYYQIALIGRRDLPLAPHPAQGFEMVMLRMLAFSPSSENESSVASPQKATTNPLSRNDHASAPTAMAIPSAPKITPAQQKENTPKDINEIHNWTDILPKLQLTGLAQALASHCTLLSISETNITLALAQKHEALLNPKLKERLEQLLSTYLNKPIKLDIKITTEELHTPAKQHEEEKTTKQVNATEAIKNDTHVQKLMGMFDATIDMDSIKAI
jgi:DNA polymerase-3 subunit gamma/tau